MATKPEVLLPPKYFRFGHHSRFSQKPEIADETWNTEEIPTSSSAIFNHHEDYRVTVNVTALKIHISENAHDALKAFPEFITEPRGEIFIKVKYYFCY